MADAPKKARGNRAMQVRVPAALRADFDALAERKGMQPSSLLRELIHQAVDGAAGPAPTPTPPTFPDTLEDLRRERVTLRLPAYVVRQAVLRAAQARSPLATWLANLVQSNVTGNPVLDLDSRLALIKATGELSSLGRNINQIARALNEAHFRTEHVKLQQLAELSKAITKLRLSMRRAVDVSMNSWRG